MNLQPWNIRTMFLLAGLAVISCVAGGGSGGNPVQPPVLPTIASIEPADAGPGDRITIRGQNLAGEGAGVAFDGVAGEVVSSTDTFLIAVVPEVPQGDRSVVVSADGSSSTPFRYRVGPAKSPMIGEIQPTRAHVGEKIIITGSNFRSVTGLPRVMVAGKGAVVESVAASRIVAYVPIVAPGSTSIVVTDGSRSSLEFPYEILHSTPTISSVFSNPTRAGLWVTIRGAYLAGIDVAVLVDGVTTEIRPSPTTGMIELAARIPDVAVGEHGLQVRVDGDLSTPFPIEVDAFSVSGIYDAHGVITRSFSGFPLCRLPAVGEERDVQVELFDNRPEVVARISISGFIDTRQYVGIVDSDGRIVERPAFPPGFSSSRIRGQVTRRPSDGRLLMDVTVSRTPDLLCTVEEHFTGLKRDAPMAPGGAVAP